MNKQLNITLHTIQTSVTECTSLVKHGDSLELILRVLDGENKVLNLEGKTVKLILKKSDSTILEETLTNIKDVTISTKSTKISSYVGSEITATLDIQATIATGVVKGEILIIDDSGSITTNTFTLLVVPTLSDSIVEESQDQIQTFAELYTALNKYIDLSIEIGGDVEAIQSLAEVKYYIDNNLPLLQAENDEAVINNTNLQNGIAEYQTIKTALDEKVLEANTFVNTHGDIIDLDNRMDSAESSIIQINADLSEKANQSDLIETNANVTANTNAIVTKADKEYVDTKFGNMGNTKTFKGSCTYAELIALTGMLIDDYWYVTDQTTNYCYNGTAWGNIGNNLKIGDKTITPEKTDFISVERTYGENLFNKNSAEIQQGKYLSNLETIVTYETTFISHKIPIQASDVVRITDDSVTSTNPGLIYDENGTMLYKISDYISRSGGVRSVLVPNDTNVSYLIFNAVISNLDVLMCTINQGLPVTYVPYSYTDNYKLSTSINISDSVTPLLDNPLNGKIGKWFGDSIVRGYGNNNVGFLDIIAENEGMIATNYAVSGSKLVDNATLLGSATSILTTVLNTDLTADYIIFDGGFNDTSHGAQGAVTTFFEEDETNVWDTATACGALEKIIYNLYTNYPTAKFGYVFPHSLKTLDFNWNTRFRSAIKLTLEKWGIPYLDLQENTPPLGNVDSLKTAYTYNSDGIHPNADGYNLFYVDKVVAWLRTL